MGEIDQFGEESKDVQEWPRDSGARAALQDFFDQKRLSPILIFVPTMNGGNLDFRGADLSGLLLLGAEFSEANIEGVRFDRGLLSGAWMHQVRAREAMFRSAVMREVQSDASDFSYAVFDGAELNGSVFIASDFTGASFCGSHVSDVIFDESNLRYGDFRGCTFGTPDGRHWVSLRRARIHGVTLEGARGVVSGPVDVGDVQALMLDGPDLETWLTERGAPDLRVHSSA
ncbi:pentapeptide repeat-containing protein [Gordonia sp. NPDC003376]